MRPPHWLFRSVLAAAALLYAGHAAAGEREELLLAVRVDQEQLSDAVMALVVDGDVRLPVGEIARLLELDVTIDANSRRIVVGPDRAVPFDPRVMTVMDGDVLAGSALFAEWFSIDVTVHRGESFVELHRASPLPFQLRRKRESDAAKLMAGHGSALLLPLIPSPYALFDGPFVDARVRTTAGAQSSADWDVFATGDLAGATATAFVHGGSEDALKGWIKAGRRDPEPVLFGPLHAREVAAGEVLFPGSDLLAVPKLGMGAAISSFPLARSAQFDTHTLSGELRPDEDVELYVNGALFGYLRGSDGGGHYTFADVPVLYGVNVFRLVFHDRRGRERVETRTFNVGDTLSRKGELDYRIVAGGRQVAEAAYGLTGTMTGTGAVTSLDVQGARHVYLSGGLRASVGTVFGYGDVARDLSGGTIGRVGLQTRVGPLSLSATRAQLQDFVSETYNTERGSIASRTTLHAGGAFGRRFVIPARLDLALEELVAGGRIVRVGGSTSAALGRILVTNNLQVIASQRLPQSSVEAAGSLQFTGARGELALHGGMEYEARPQRAVNALAVSTDWRHFRNIGLSAALECDFTSHQSRATAAIRRDAGRYAISTIVEVPIRGRPAVRLELSTSALHNPLSRRWAFRGKPSASAGAAAAIVFLDANDNGVYDKGDEPIRGAGFVVNGDSSPTVSDASGIAFLDNLPADRRSEIAVATGTLEDPGWRPATPSAAFIARPGKPLIVNFPIVIAGEITGTISREGGAASAIRIELLRADGTRAGEALSAYDGFYVFNSVKPGTYKVCVPGEVTSHLVTVSAADHLIDHIDLLLPGKKT